jgi:uncharacterized protein (DUF1015 family)
VWRIDDPERVAAIAAAVAATPVVIADGHHRYETSLAYRDEVRVQREADAAAEAATEGDVDAAGSDEVPDDEFEDDDFEDDEDVTAALQPEGGDEEDELSADDADGPGGAGQDDLAADDGAGLAEATMAFVVELVGDQLTVRPIHRLLSGLRRGIDLAQVLEPWFTAGAIVESYAVEKGSVLGRMTAAGAVALIRPDGSARLLTPKREAFEGVADLDSARLAHALSAALADEPPDIRYQHGVEHVVEAVAVGEADAGFLLRPATVAQIAANAHAGDRMPPKTTFFHPKPKTGIVFRSLV